jgi:hypothetical protein
MGKQRVSLPNAITHTFRGKTMSSTQIALTGQQSSHSSGSLLLGTGLAFASLILVPAFAVSLGIGPSLTGALRIALMKASHRAVGGSSNGSEAATTTFACH